VNIYQLQELVDNALEESGISVSADVCETVARRINEYLETEWPDLDMDYGEYDGLDPAELGGSAWRAAAVSFMLFALGAIVPVAPYMFLGGGTALSASVGLSALALAGIGFVTSLFNGRSPWFSAGRQVLIGCVAAAVTYGTGLLMGVSLS